MKNNYSKRARMPKKIMEKLANDLQYLMETNEGTLLAIQLLENLPYHSKLSLIANLSAVHNQEVAKLMHVIAREYPKEELGELAHRSLKKLSLAGVPPVDPNLFQVSETKSKFYKATVSRTRLKGDMSLVMFFEEADTYAAYFFNLSFGEMGIKEFYYTKQLAKEQMQTMLEQEVYMEVSYDQSLNLLSLAHDYNQEHESLPALGIFIYEWLLKDADGQVINEVNQLGDLLWPEVTPAILANALCLALRREDFQLVELLAGGSVETVPEIGLLIHSELGEISTDPAGQGEMVEVILKVEEEDGLYQLSWNLSFEKNEEGWWILQNVVENQRIKVDYDWLEDALSANTATTCYYLHQPHGTRLFIESLEGMELFQEGEGIDLYKWWDLDHIVEHGISFRDGVLADVLIGEEEMVIMTKDQEKLKQVQEFLETHLEQDLELMDEEDTPFEVVYRVYDQENMSFNQLVDHWTLSGSSQKDQLNTWLTTKLSDLGGMTPMEASDSRDGAKKLWGLVKKIQREAKGNTAGLVHYHTLLQAVGWGKKLGKLDKIT